MPNATKTCVICHLELTLDAFHALQSASDGRRSQCRECRAAARRKGPVIPPGHKRCPSCERVQLTDAFYQRGRYLRSWCRECEGTRKSQLRELVALRRSAERAELVAAILEAGEKACHTCEETHPLTHYYHNQGRMDGYMASCKGCTDERRNRPDPIDAERAERWTARRAAFAKALESSRPTGD